MRWIEWRGMWHSSQSITTARGGNSPRLARTDCILFRIFSNEFFFTPIHDVIGASHADVTLEGRWPFGRIHRRRWGCGYAGLERVTRPSKYQPKAIFSKWFRVEVERTDCGRLVFCNSSSLWKDRSWSS